MYAKMHLDIQICFVLIHEFIFLCYMYLRLIYLIIFHISYLFEGHVLWIYLIISKNIVSQCQGKKKRNPTVDRVNNHKPVFTY